jgi:TetR/AcrR family hemagglutinin/protease transcriptional regulator
VPARKANPRKPRRRLEPAARRAELLAAAVEAFSRRGLGRAAHSDVAGKAGCSLSTTFVYFPTREALVDAVLDEIERFFVGMVERAGYARTPAPEAVHRIIHAFTMAVDEHPAYARIWLEWSTAVRERIWDRYQLFIERIVTELAGTIERGKRDGSVPATTDGEDSARLLVGAAHMVAQMKIAGQPKSKVDHFLDTLFTAATGIGRRP